MIEKVGESESVVYKALVELSRSIAGHGDLESLFTGLARSLRTVVTFDFLGLMLYQPATKRLRLHLLTPDMADRPEIVEHPAEISCAVGWVWENQKPLIVTSMETEPRWPELVPLCITKGVKSLVIVPLTNGEHRVGTLGFGSYTAIQPSAEQIEFLERVASEFAVAVDSYLTRQELARERDRLAVLFDITNALVSALSWDALVTAISDQLKRVIDHDVAAVTVLNKETGCLHLRGWRISGDIPWNMEAKSSPQDGLPAAEAIRTGLPIVMSEPDVERFKSPIYREGLEAGFRTACSIPLITRNGACGTLEIGRRSPEPFTEDQVELLVQVGRQVAIALENSIAYTELAELKDKLATENLYLADELRSDLNIGNMVGESPAFQSVLSSLQIVAPTDATVLICGETGTGKELVARALHDLSTRSKKSFIKVNCAAIPASLLESELFGHEKGSFTGALAQKMGRFELADRGTLFLDEVGEIPLELQSKLLRAIQEQEFERLGGTRTIHVDIRLVAATNRDLKQMVEEGKFRSDLYYRLHVFPLLVPPLRERPEDIPLLVRYFTQKYSQRLKRNIETIPSPAMAALCGYDWPGNIRELQNVIERSVVLTTGHELRMAFPEAGRPLAASAPPPSPLERDRILRALRDASGRISGPGGAAERLGLKRTTLQSRMKKLNIGREYH